MANPPLDASGARLLRHGRAAFPGFELERLARVTSTQERVRRAARNGAAEGFCCLAAEQTAGRGRQGRRWAAPPGTGLLMSVLLMPAGTPTLVPLAAGIAVSQALAELGVSAGLKWPNDVLVAGRKIAGILAEIEPSAARRPAVVLGIGVNLTVPSFPADARGVSVHELVAAVPAAEDLAGAILERLAAVTALPEAALLDSWRSLALGLGDPVTVTSATARITGVSRDVDVDGALLIDVDGALVRVIAGDVHLERDTV